MENGLNEILYCVDQISQKSHGSKLSVQFFKSVTKQSLEVSKYLGTDSNRLSVLWSIFFGLSIQNSSVDFDDFARYTNLSIVKVMSFASEFEQLVYMKLLRQDRSSDRRRRKMSERLTAIKYFVPADIILSLTRGETTIPIRTKVNLSKYQILDIVSNLISNELYNEVITYRDLCDEIEFLFEENTENQFIKQISSLQLPMDEQVILLMVCSEFTDYEENINLVRLLKILFQDTQSQLDIRKSFMANNTKLQELDLVDLKVGEFKSDREICLTENGRTLLFEEDVKFFVKQEKVNHKDIILSTNIIEKQLFFNEKDRKSLEFLTDLLQPDNYKSIVERMKSKGIKPQIIVLLHGKPGCGKTEFVLQIAKSTGRNLNSISVENTKHHFYGDSERLTAKIFTDFAVTRNLYENEPILFINEIDGLLGSRSVSGSSAVDATEHSRQSILLNKLENFEGILFGTTNIWKRLDQSYMRRFGFRYELTFPDSNTRFQIWKYKLPLLTDQHAKQLSEDFDLSGGMIDNICRKISMKEILTGDTPDINEILDFCQQEFMEDPNEKRRIGYAI
jgi:AAA+ superfamily predicted ATPase